MNRILIFVLTATSVACSGTTSYRKAATSIAVMPIAENTLQVGVKADDSLMDQFLLRRCAEVTLEHGARYFTLGNRYHAERKVWTPSAGFFGGKPPEGKVTVKILQHEEPDAFDALIVVKETNAAAKGELSLAAKASIVKFSK